MVSISLHSMCLCVFLVLFLFVLLLEYYRFLHIQERCCLKWQTTIDKFGQLIKEHERCERVNTDLTSNLRHITQQWINEKRKRQNAELERDFYVSNCRDKKK